MEFLYLRQAGVEDRKLLFDWRNDPLVRRNSFTTDPIAWEDHVRWFGRLMDDPQARQYILMAESARDPEIRDSSKPAESVRDPEGGDSSETAETARAAGMKELRETAVPVGQIRLRACEDDPCAYEISYSVAAEARGRGYGRKLLEMIKEQAPQDLPRLHTLIGRVKKDNPASAAAFRSAGYTHAETQPCDVFTFTCRAPAVKRYIPQ